MNKTLRFLTLSLLMAMITTSTHGMQRHFMVADGFENFKKQETWFDCNMAIYKYYIPYLTAQAEHIDEQLTSTLAEDNVDLAEVRMAFMEYAQRVIPIKDNSETSLEGLEHIEEETLIICKKIYAMLYKIETTQQHAADKADNGFTFKKVLLGLGITTFAVGGIAYGLLI